MIPFCYTVLANVHFSGSLLLFLNKTSRRFSLCQCTEKKFKNEKILHNFEQQKERVA